MSDRSTKGGERTSKDRRKFIRTMLATATIVGSNLGKDSYAESPGSTPNTARKFRSIEQATVEKPRILRSVQTRTSAALANAGLPIPENASNGDEDSYSNKIGSYHKGLPHNALGEVDLRAYQSMADALTSGRPEDFESIRTGGNIPLSDPQGGLAFDLEGCDPQQTFMPPAPSLASEWRAAEAIEDYWMALLRDVDFSDYPTDDMAERAVRELNHLSGFQGSRQHDQVTPQTLFRGFTKGELIGPYVSQFLLQPVKFGGLEVNQRYSTYLADTDYLTRAASWLVIQNGQGPFAPGPVDSTPRYIRNGRGLSAYVHSDSPIQAYLAAAQWMLSNEVPMNSGNPYTHSLTQAGFATFGTPHLCSLLGQAANCALKAVWYHKWYVHRTLRPEAYSGLVHWTMTGKAKYPVHPQILSSHAVDQVFRKYGTYFLPVAYVEGCPQHPSYGQGHAAIAGACVTILKAFFNTDSIVFPNPVQASSDGLSLVPYMGSDASHMTLGNELNKLAGNISLARNFAGIHWRSDYDQALRLGETVAISLLRDQRMTFNERFKGFTFSKFDSTQANV